MRNSLVKRRVRSFLPDDEIDDWMVGGGEYQEVGTGLLPSAA